MLYCAEVKKAFNIAYNAHAGQYDKSGIPYIFHPVHIAERMSSVDEIIVALLHDVVEDTKLSLKDLQKEGTQENILEAIALLTHDKSEDYMEYIKKIKKNTLACTVKIADLEHNSDITRIDNPSVDDYKRLDKYKKALDILRG